MLSSLLATLGAMGAPVLRRGAPKETADDLIGAMAAPGRPRWGRALLAGAVVGAVPYLLWWLGVWGYALYLIVGQGLRQGAAGAGGIATVGNAIGSVSPALHLLLTAGAAVWVARRAGAVPVGHGLLVGLASVASNLGLDLLFFPPLSEAVTYASASAWGNAWVWPG